VGAFYIFIAQESAKTAEETAQPNRTKSVPKFFKTYKICKKYTIKLAKHAIFRAFYLSKRTGSRVGIIAY
jgi:hypothetical protein